MEAEQFGIPGVVVTAPGFKEFGHIHGRDQGVPSLQVAVYPGVFEVHTKDQLEENTKKIVVPQIIEALTNPIPAAASFEEKNPREIVFEGSIEEVNKYFTDQQWSDGMAIIPPTPERVEEFLKYTDYSPHEEIAVLPGANLRATPWNIAINGVMAGCRPEYMPVLIAMVQAFGDPAFRLSSLGGSTHSFTPFLWVNGPIARQLGIDYGQGLIAHPTNRVIGRALSLIERNIAGFRIKETQMGSFGKTLPWVLAEDEEAMDEIGWEPYHVEKGFDKNVSTVSAGSSTVWGQNLIPATFDPEIIMQLMAYGITYGESFASGNIGSTRHVLVEPGVAEVLAYGGYTKRSLKEDLVKNGRKITYEWIFSKVYGSFGDVLGTFEEELAKALADPAAEKGKLPPWYPRFKGWEEIQTTPAIRPDRIEIIVCGDPSRNKVQTLAGGGNTIKEIRLPANWDELMEKVGYRPLKAFFIKK